MKSQERSGSTETRVNRTRSVGMMGASRPRLARAMGASRPRLAAPCRAPGLAVIRPQIRPPLLAVCVALLASGCADRRPAQPVQPPSLTFEPLRYGRVEGWSVRTAHYRIRTTLHDRERIAVLARSLERSYRYYRTLLPAAREPVGPMPVYVFARRQTWEHFTRRFAPERAGVLLRIRNGGYMHRGVCVVEYVAPQVTFPIVAHEGMHQFIWHCADRATPAWLSEGLAVLCEGQRWGRDGIDRFDPWHNPPRRNALALLRVRDELRPLSELLRTNAGRVVHEPGRRVLGYYGQVWSLMLFLRYGDDGAWAERFEKLLEAVGRGQVQTWAQAAALGRDGPTDRGTALFAAFFGADLDAMDAAWRRFIDHVIFRP